MNIESPGTLKVGEVHPMAANAYAYVKYHLTMDPFIVEALASTAMSGNRSAEICSETLRRVIEGEPVSDRYLLGLSWMLKEIEENKCE